MLTVYVKWSSCFAESGSQQFVIKEWWKIKYDVLMFQQLMIKNRWVTEMTGQWIGLVNIFENKYEC